VGGVLTLGTVSTNGWDVGAFTAGGAIASAPNTTLSVTNCEDEGIEALQRGLCFVPGAQVVTVYNFALKVLGSGLGFGFASGYGSFIWCANSAVSSSSVAYFARTESGIYAYNVTPGTYTGAPFSPSVNTYNESENAFIDSNWVLGQGGGGQQPPADRPALRLLRAALAAHNLPASLAGH
jgi:hypothetical protein